MTLTWGAGGASVFLAFDQKYERLAYFVQTKQCKVRCVQEIGNWVVIVLVQRCFERA